MSAQPNFETAIQHWLDLTPYLYVPHDDQEYQRIVCFLDTLIDQVGENERHPLASLMEIVGVLVERYEEAHVPE